MAKNIENLANAVAASADYPSGRPALESSLGAGDGTPMDDDSLFDGIEFFAKLLRESESEPNDLPDNTSNGFQLFRAFKRLAHQFSKLDYLIPIGSFTEFDSANGAIPKLIKMTHQYFALLYIGENDYPTCQIYQVNADGSRTYLQTAIIESTALNGSFKPYSLDGVRVGDNHIIVVYSGVYNDGFAKLLSFDYDTPTITVEATVEYDATDSNYGSIVYSDSSKAIVFHKASGSDEVAVTLSYNLITPSISVVGSSSFDNAPITQSKIASINITSRYHMAAWMPTDGGVDFRTFDIDTSDGSVTPLGSEIEIINHTATQGFRGKFVRLHDDYHYLFVFPDIDDDALSMQLIEVNESTFIPTKIGSLVTVSGSGYSTACYVSNGHIQVLRQTAFTNLKTAVYTYDFDTPAITLLSSTIDISESSESIERFSDIIHMGNGITVAAWTGEDNDGFIQCFENLV